MSDGLRGTSVLVVDDDADNAEMLAMYMEGGGASVRTARSGPEALVLLPSWKPDVFLLDISLPEMDGYDLLKAIRLEPAFRDVPAVAVTAHAFERDKQRATEAGFSVHVSKPFDGEAMVYLVERLTAKDTCSSDPDSYRAFHAVLDAQGIHEALGFLNRRTAHRFTGVYRFDGDVLRNLYLFDRLSTSSLTGGDAPMRETYCSLVGAAREPFSAIDTLADDRLFAHPARGHVQSYCGVLLRGRDGVPFGSLCHFDLVPAPLAPDTMDLLKHAALLISAELGRDE